MAVRPGSNQERRIVIRREEIVAGGHHGGSWKIAYADFVTAMMAFFLVMWLINATSEQQRRGIASFFNPLANHEAVTPPADGMMPPVSKPVAIAGHTYLLPHSPNRRDPVAGVAPQGAANKALAVGSGPAESVRPRLMLVQDVARKPDAASETGRKIADGLRSAVLADTRTRMLADQVHVMAEPDGLHVEIADSDKQSMFDFGATMPNARAVVLLRIIVPYLMQVQGNVSVEGYTDAAPFQAGRLSNWTLSAMRADAARTVLVVAGLPDWRVRSVVGHGARDLAEPDAPMAASNRRLVLVLHDGRGQDNFAKRL